MSAAELLDKQITESLPQLSVKQKKTVLTVVKTFMQEQQDWWQEIGEEQQKAINRAIMEMKKGEVTPNDEVMKKYAKWLKK